MKTLILKTGITELLYGYILTASNEEDNKTNTKQKSTVLLGTNNVFISPVRDNVLLHKDITKTFCGNNIYIGVLIDACISNKKIMDGQSKDFIKIIKNLKINPDMKYKNINKYNIYIRHGYIFNNYFDKVWQITQSSDNDIILDKGSMVDIYVHEKK